MGRFDFTTCANPQFVDLLVYNIVIEREIKVEKNVFFLSIHVMILLYHYISFKRYFFERG